ncbi:MAG: FGGY family carbohydrate kinase [Candidatus Choladocola sp.]|nr:FGGY family carbohydrate kinase [Candidatus Choladocola sp.]
MKAMGIDIGTTTVCGIVIDAETGHVLDVATLNNDSSIQGQPYAWEQDPERIWQLVQQMYRHFLTRYTDICSIGLTGQMHGMVYTDENGQAVSSLYTWQDERGNEAEADGRKYVEHLSEITGYPMATGFAAATHYFHVKNHMVPENAKHFCTIHDYIGMKLTGEKAPVSTTSDCASFGCFDLEKLDFDRDAFAKAGMDPSILPRCEKGYVLVGRTPEGIPVGAGIGDNQASVIGSVKDAANSVLVNVGTGSQISTGVDHFIRARHVELRPLAGDSYILAGSSLCGGRAYAALEQFLRRTVALMTSREPSEKLYGKMADVLEKRGVENSLLTVNTRFCGTRENPEITGSLTNLTLDSFSPEELILGVLGGIAEELVTFHRHMLEQGARKPLYLTGSGNGLRMNPYLRKIFENIFGMEMQIPVHKEEAAYGAALYAMTAAGIYPTLEAAQQLITYL